MCALRHASKTTCNVHSVCWVSRTCRNWQLQKRYSRINTIQIIRVLSKHVKYSQVVYPSNTSKALYNHYQPRQTLHVRFALDSCLLFRLWLRRIFRFVWFTSIQAWNHEIPATSLIIMEILPPQNTGFNIECLRTLLLHLRSPQNRGTFHEVIREHVLACPLQLQRYKCCAHVPCSVLAVSNLQQVGAAAASVVQFAAINSR